MFFVQEGYDSKLILEAGAGFFELVLSRPLQVFALKDWSAIDKTPVSLTALQARELAEGLRRHVAELGLPAEQAARRDGRPVPELRTPVAQQPAIVEYLQKIRKAQPPPQVVEAPQVFDEVRRANPGTPTNELWRIAASLADRRSIAARPSLPDEASFNRLQWALSDQRGCLEDILNALDDLVRTGGR